MSEYFVWGISKWREFEQCPAMFHAKHITKKWKDFPNDAMERGRRVHKELEEAIKYDLELPDELQHMDPLVVQFIELRRAGAAVVPEHKFGVSITFQSTDYFKGDRLRVRCALDLFVDDKRKILGVDWKTGKPKGEHREEAEFYGAMTMVTHGALSMDMMYFYVDEPAASFTVHIEEPTLTAANWWKKFEYGDKIIAGNPPRTPCNACAWCGAFECPNNRNRKLIG